jgi:hypothetical protein
VRCEFLPLNRGASRGETGSPQEAGFEGRTQGSPYTSMLPPEKAHSTGLLRWDAGGPQAAFAGPKRSEYIRDDGDRMCEISQVTLTIQLRSERRSNPMANP